MLLNALTAANIFRDMSGLAGTQGLAQAAGAGAVSAGSTGLTAATTAQQIEAQRSVALQQLGAEMFRQLVGAGMAAAGAGVGGTAGARSRLCCIPADSGRGQGNGCISAGAKINQGRDMDSRAVRGPASGRQSSGGGGGSGSGGVDTANGPGGSTSSPGPGAAVPAAVLEVEQVCSPSGRQRASSVPDNAARLRR